MAELTSATVDRLISEGEYWFFVKATQTFYGVAEEGQANPGDLYLLDASEPWLAQFADSQAIADYLAPLLPRLPPA